MAKGILGRKLGMTQIFSENGVLIPVTVVDVNDNVILQQKTVEKDGYAATQIGFGSKKKSVTNKPEVGHTAKAQTTPKHFVREIRFSEGLENELSTLEVGAVINETLFNVGEVIDVTGTTKGKGFAGVIKRHNQARGPMAHGSRYHRRPGSMGPIKGKLIGKNLPGHMGHEKVTTQNLKIVDIDQQNNLLLISGAIPGPTKGYVIIKTAVKTAK